MVGQTLGHYRILDKLGAGGMGEVYRAEDTTLKRQVALKVLPPDLAASQERLDRFQREAESLAALNHPNIAHVYTVEEDEGTRFLTMELVEGQPLSHLIPKGGMSLERIFEFAIPLADGLATAHDKGVIHRDLKPANIMVTDEGRVKVLDFGLAKLREPASQAEATALPTEPMTAEGTIVGTMPYMSPEQLEGKDIDARSDIFSLGVMLYEMATGERPFKGDSSASLITAIMSHVPREVDSLRVELPHHLSRIIRHCLEKEPTKRYQSALDVRNELQDLHREESFSAATAVSSEPESESTWKRVRWPLVAAAVAGAAIVLVALWLGRSQSPTESPTEPPAESAAAEAQPPMIVVLPFENLGDPDDDYFTAGMTEEITSRLATVSSLSVISRNSAVRYAKTEKSIQQIGDELGVDYVLEGTVRWANTGNASQVRITPQLIQVANDTQLWANSYDRVIDDIFEIQSDIASEVIDQLGITLGVGEREGLQTRPTENLEAYQAYLRGLQYRWTREERSMRLGMEMLERAVELDAEFAVAHALLSEFHSRHYHYRYDFTPERLRQAKASADRAMAVQPDLPEGHRALGWYYYFGQRDYDRASRQFAVAAEALPNDPSILLGTMSIARRQGRWSEAKLTLERLLTADPQSYVGAIEASVTFRLLREFAKAEEEARRAQAIAPDAPEVYFFRALNFLSWDGTTGRARRLLDLAPSTDSTLVTYLSLQLDLFERKPAQALAQLDKGGIEEFSLQDWYVPKELLECVCLSRMGEQRSAQIACDSAIVVIQGEIEARPGDHRLFVALGHSLALLGRREQAIHAGQEARELMSISKDVIDGMIVATEVAKIYTQADQYDDALSLVEELLKIPGVLTARLLQLDPVWDPLRNHPRFQALLEKYGQEP